jgi:hypothetical protein
MVCLAAVTDLSGKWTATIKGQDGSDFQLNYLFKIDGNKLTGTVTSPQGEIPITDGTVNGSDFSFTVSVNGSDIKNVGKYYAAADSAGINVDFGGNNFHIPLKRDVATK